MGFQLQRLKKSLVLTALATGLAYPAGLTKAAELRECTVILEAVSGKTLYRHGACNTRLSPASTFKVALALIGFDAGILKDAHKPVLTFRPNSGSSMQDRAEADPEIWLKDSLLWYSRELTRQLGTKKFADDIRKLNYGNADLAGDTGKNNGLSQSWVDSSLRISPDEQAALMGRIFDCSVPVSREACAQTKAIMPRFTTQDGQWAVQGKTGTVLYRTNKQGLRTGWFVGWAEKDGRTIMFATIRDQIGNQPLPASFQVRNDFLRDLSKLVQ